MTRFGVVVLAVAAVWSILLPEAQSRALEDHEIDWKAFGLAEPYVNPNFGKEPKRLSPRARQLHGLDRKAKPQEAQQEVNEGVDRELIVGGIEATRRYGYYCRMSIIRDDELDYDCGGVLLSDRFCMTAAHCVWDFQRNTVRSDVFGATVGYLCEDEGSNCGEELGVFQAQFYWMHPEWSPDRKILDLAILRLNATVDFVEPAQPDVGTHYPELSYGYDDQLRTVGFGLTEDFVTPFKLNELSLGFMPTDICEYIWGYLYSGVVCVYTNDHAKGLYGRGLCNGDSGSPTVKPLQGAPDVVVGLTSFGSVPCNSKSRPDVLARVSAGISWFSKIMCFPGISQFTPEWCSSFGFTTGEAAGGSVFSGVLDVPDVDDSQGGFEGCQTGESVQFRTNIKKNKFSTCGELAQMKNKKVSKLCRKTKKSDASILCCTVCEPLIQKQRKFFGPAP